MQDGKYYESNEIHIEVTDINDTPPKFVAAVPSVIYEEEPIVSISGKKLHSLVLKMIFFSQI